MEILRRSVMCATCTSRNGVATCLISRDPICMYRYSLDLWMLVTRAREKAFESFPLAAAGRQEPLQASAFEISFSLLDPDLVSSENSNPQKKNHNRFLYTPPCVYKSELTRSYVRASHLFHKTRKERAASPSPNKKKKTKNHKRHIPQILCFIEINSSTVHSTLPSL